MARVNQPAINSTGKDNWYIFQNTAHVQLHCLQLQMLAMLYIHNVRMQNLPLHEFHRLALLGLIYAQQLTCGVVIQDLRSLAYNCHWDTKIPTWLVHNSLWNVNVRVISYCDCANSRDNTFSVVVRIF